VIARTAAAYIRHIMLAESGSRGAGRALSRDSRLACTGHKQGQIYSTSVDCARAYRWMTERYIVPLNLCASCGPAGRSMTPSLTHFSAGSKRLTRASGRQMWTKHHVGPTMVRWLTITSRQSRIAVIHYKCPMNERIKSMFDTKIIRDFVTLMGSS